MRLSSATVGTLLGLALILCGCGEGRTDAAGGPASTVGTAATATSTATKAAKSPTPPKAACETQLHGFLGSMNALREVLARGLSYDEYLHEVGGLRVAYRRIEASRLPIGCLLASGTPGERAFNFYIDAANAWGDCLATVSCDTASIEPQLQHRWALASRQLSAAQQGLRRAARD
jgi:hypothetical protein